MAQHRLSSEGYMKRLEECNEAWRAFPELPGEHLSWNQETRWVSDIVTRDGRLLATVEGCVFLTGINIS